MPKQGEIDYLLNLGEDGRLHALNKPFSDVNCGFYLHDIGIIMSLLPPSPARLLDLGAGSGWTSCFFAMRGYDVLAQDIATDMVSQLEENRERYRIPRSRLEAVVSDYESLEIREAFDCAVFYDSLHHAEDERQALLSAYNALKPGGILVTAEPGAGHAETSSARNAVQSFGITEKDMPPRKIIRIAKSIGFRQSRVYLRQTTPTMLTPGLPHAIKKSIRNLISHFRENLLDLGHFVALVK